MPNEGCTSDFRPGVQYFDSTGDLITPFRLRALVLIRSPLFVFAVAFAVRLALMFATHSYRDVELTEVVRVANSLAEHGTFADAFGPGTGPTAHVSPAYPILLSLIFRAFGTGATGELAQAIFASFISSLAYAMLPLLSSAAALTPEVGGIAGILGAILPVNYWAETKGSFEAPLAGLCLILFCVAVSRSWHSQDFSIRTALITGFISGIALLTSPSLAPPIIMALILGFAFRGTNSVRTYGLYAGIVFLASIVCLTPWAIRNRMALGSTLWTRSGLGIELSISNADSAAANMYDNMQTGWFQRSHPFSSNVERARLVRIGEITYNHERMKQAIQWIAQHPWRFTILSMERVYYFWFPRMRRTWQRLLMALFAVGGFAGALLLLRQHNPSGWLFFSSLASYSFIYYFIQSFARYRTPIHWVLVLLTTFAVSDLVSRVNSSNRKPNTLRI